MGHYFGCLARMPLPRMLGCRWLDLDCAICAESRGVESELHGPVHGRAGTRSCEVRSCGRSPRLSLEAGLGSEPGDGLRRAMAATRLTGLQQRLRLLLRLRVASAWMEEAVGRKVLVVGPEPALRAGWKLVMAATNPL